jgi:putative ABC transport system ATP-binding protein
MTLKNENIFKVEGIKKDFIVGGQTINVLKGIDLEIKVGDFTVIFGPSGCGKSTLLHSVLGLEPPTAGKVTIDGVSLYDMDEDGIVEYRKEKIGVVFQQSIWIKSLNVIENISFPIRLKGIDKKTAEDTAIEKLRIVKLEDWAYHHPSELSSGQQQRISLARALTTDPAIIVADEPTGNLDTVSGDELMELLSKLNKEHNKTILMVTHDLEYLKYANRLFHIVDGLKAEEFVGDGVKKMSFLDMRNKKGVRTKKTVNDKDYLAKNGQRSEEGEK